MLLSFLLADVSDLLALANACHHHLGHVSHGRHLQGGVRPHLKHDTQFPWPYSRHLVLVVEGGAFRCVTALCPRCCCSVGVGTVGRHRALVRRKRSLRLSSRIPMSSCCYAVVHLGARDGRAGDLCSDPRVTLTKRLPSTFSTLTRHHPWLMGRDISSPCYCLAVASPRCRST
ncbi:hypothetical protein QBC33DRAFT_138558 [Phialemonium atrogriseum]|uniref:Secreted protein n=1 Tax=Phialemonium atrogriseum TaxID=1093897 RepID=A0AAJ0BWL7_9PEZI|nr:uncharacterized protein QBC33DRAFT_138558 [Phialemonium atrogriseum]KAK1765815.1 hypothetical protein QBC33DRAFT_138558 [Phialemonium atrogriseum]